MPPLTQPGTRGHRKRRLRPDDAHAYERSAPPVGEAFRPPAGGPDLGARPVRKPNRLPLETYREAGAYSLTLVTHDRSTAFSTPSVIEHCREILRAQSSAHGFQVFAYCFMPDHLHLLVGSEENRDLLRFVKAFKQQTGYWFKNRGPAGGLKASPTGANAPGLWQRSFHDHIVRSEESLRVLAEYVLDNPVVAGLTQNRGEYAWAGSFVWDDLY